MSTCRSPYRAAIVYRMLYEEIGGAAVLRTAVAVLHQRVLADPALAPWFTNVDLVLLRAHQHAFLTAALDGPNLFTGRHLTDAHAGHHVSNEAFDRLTDHLTAVLRDLGVAPAKVAEVSERLDALRPLVIEDGQPSGSGVRASGSGVRAEGERAR